MGDVIACVPSSSHRKVGKRIESLPVPHDKWQDLILKALACLRKEVGSLPHVKKIGYHPKGQLLTVWTFIDDNSSKNLRACYLQERAVINGCFSRYKV